MGLIFTQFPLQLSKRYKRRDSFLKTIVHFDEKLTHCHSFSASKWPIVKMSQIITAQYYMAKSASGQDKGDPTFWLANQVGWMGQSCPLGSLVPRRSLLTRCLREVWERAGESSRRVSLGDVTAHGRVQDWPRRERLVTRLPTRDFPRLFHKKKCSFRSCNKSFTDQTYSVKMAEYLTIIPRARMDYWLRGHEGERNKCFSKIQLAGQQYREKNNFS